MGVLEYISPSPLTHVCASFKATQNNVLWITMAESSAGRSQYFSPDLLRDLCTLYKSVESAGGNWISNGVRQPIHYLVVKSAHPEYFSLGGDLSHFRECIRQRNKKGLLDYSMLCADMIYDLATRLNRDATTIALIQGRALGGGFESALAADFIIAEEHSEFGFPEILFGLFPCTGGMSLLARRIGVHAAERMMTNGKMYAATELKSMGVVDEICARGEGEVAVEKFIAEHSRHRIARLMLQRSRHRLAALSYEELRIVVEEWAETAVNLSAPHLRVMDMLIDMQRARVAG
ncbi:enoyl-CoA hydratase [Pseudolysobacter antarcticus]|uniref:Enoyl-CoA hydratase n=1 Tax=Pseudolysobacter antarcticus TaxID=2511995 RepID=A0A411HJ10_9GAMM|nr:crotonase/enoyl-CoA hydratase family protein [Pseudolysobacter antarcticus]QBB70516.1 enoyl-CoA hydratase [Pseudolysobacter antarcticus]